jgi:hypothetical protein
VIAARSCQPARNATPRMEQQYVRHLFIILGLYVTIHAQVCTLYTSHAPVTFKTNNIMLLAKSVLQPTG